MVSGFHGWRFLCPVLLLTIVLPHAAQAWQFRELDDDAPVQAADDATDESSGLIDLTPIKEWFTATDPVETPKQVTKVQTKKDEKKAVPQPVAKPTPKVAPEPKTPKPAKEKAAATEPQESSAVKTDANRTVDALELIKQGIDAIPEGKEVYSISYSGIVPGQSNLKDVVAQLGEASHTIEQDENAATHVYQAAPHQLDVAIVDDVVTSILVRLQKSAARDELIERLGLESLKSVPIPDEYGEVLGQAYPERGLLFAFVEGESKSLQQVSAVLLEPISAEPFRLRAEYDFEHQYEQSIADLDQAIQLDPSDDVAFWIRAQKLDASGQTTDAMASIEKAVELKPTSPRYRLTRADLYAKTDRLQEGISEIKSLLRELDMEDEVMAESHNLLGDLMTIGPKADHQVAMKNHLKAIDFASKCVDDKRFSVRRSAKETLVRAHASVARDIALGNFQRQAEVVPKWLMRM